MTTEEICKAKPGRDLDIRVALEVMGYIWLKHLLQFSAELAVKWLGTPADLKESCGMYVVVPDSQFVALKERENFAEAVLSFSTEIGPAEEVIRHMEESGYEYHLETKTEQGANVYYACFSKPGSTSKTMSAGAATIPEAIAKAALLAVAAG